MITRLHVKNFKSLKDVSFSLGPLTMLVGPNMGGKSNILDVFSFVQQMLFPQPGVDGLTFALAQRGGIGEVLWKGGNESLVAFRFDGTDPKSKGSSWSYLLEIVAGLGGYAQVQRESLVVREGDAEKELIVQEDNVRWLANRNGQKIVSSSSGTRSAMGSVPENWDGVELISSFRLWMFYQLIPQVMREPNQTGAGLGLDRHGRNISAWLMTLQTRYPESFRRIMDASCDLFPGLKSIFTWPTPQGTVFLASNEQGLKQSVGIRGMSDGELAFLSLISLVYAPPELTASLYCIEEPENHLHPQLVEALVRLARQVRQEVVDAGGTPSQIILTTHSPLLVDTMELDEILWVDKKDGETRIVRPGDQEHLRALVTDKHFGLGDIVYSGSLRDLQ